jgi:hypothetical protein
VGRKYSNPGDLDRLKGSLCFSSNFNAVFFVPDTESATGVFDWNVLIDPDRFDEFQRFFDLHPADVRNSFYIDATASEVSRWLDMFSRSGASSPDFAADQNSALANSENSHDVIDINSASMIPSEWRNGPIETFIKAVNLGSREKNRGKRLCLISCDKHSHDLSRFHANVDLVEITRGSFRDRSVQSVTNYINSNGIKHAILLGHGGCNSSARSQEATEIFDTLLVEGWTSQAAQDYLTPRFPVVEELLTLQYDYQQLKGLWSSVRIAPLLLNQFTKVLQLPGWYDTSRSGDPLFVEQPIRFN